MGMCLAWHEQCCECCIAAQMCPWLVGDVLCRRQGSPAQGWLQGDSGGEVLGIGPTFVTGDQASGEMEEGALGRSGCLLHCLQMGTILCRVISREPKAWVRTADRAGALWYHPAYSGHSWPSFIVSFFQASGHGLLDQSDQTSLAHSITAVLSGRGCWRSLIPPYLEQDCCRLSQTRLCPANAPNNLQGSGSTPSLMT